MMGVGLSTSKEEAIEGNVLNGRGSGKSRREIRGILEQLINLSNTKRRERLSALEGVGES